MEGAAILEGWAVAAVGFEDDVPIEVDQVLAVGRRSLGGADAVRVVADGAWRVLVGDMLLVIRSPAVSCSSCLAVFPVALRGNASCCLRLPEGGVLSTMSSISRS